VLANLREARRDLCDDAALAAVAAQYLCPQESYRVDWCVGMKWSVWRKRHQYRHSFLCAQAFRLPIHRLPQCRTGAIAGNRAQDGAGWRDVGCQCACKAGCNCMGMAEYQASNPFLCILERARSAQTRGLAVATSMGSGNSTILRGLEACVDRAVA
jgi:hypothetical protein